jgi:hypothetical protein
MEILVFHRRAHSVSEDIRSNIDHLCVPVEQKTQVKVFVIFTVRIDHMFGHL